MVYGVWRLLCCIWCMMDGDVGVGVAWCMWNVVWCVAYVVWCIVYGIGCVVYGMGV